MSMKTLLILTSTLLISQCYYVSPNRFTYDEGLKFCKNYCASNLASIHSEAQQIDAIETIKSGQIIFTVPHQTQNVWFGLQHDHINQKWEWQDQTSFDYGNNTNHTSFVPY